MKRVKIGTELIMYLSVIIINEPTSVLDLTSAVALLCILYYLVKVHGKTVIASINQPSSAVLCFFNNFMLLADGYVIYLRSPGSLLTHLEWIGFTCPPGYNA